MIIDIYIYNYIYISMINIYIYNYIIIYITIYMCVFLIGFVTPGILPPLILLFWNLGDEPRSFQRRTWVLPWMAESRSHRCTSGAGHRPIYPLVMSQFAMFAIENGPVEIVSLPISSMVIFHSKMLAYQRVPIKHGYRYTLW